MFDWWKYDNQNLKDGEYLLCILGDAGNNSGGLILRYVLAKNENRKFYFYLKDEGYLPLKDVIWYEKIIAFVNIMDIEFDNPLIVWNETLFVSNGSNLIVQYIRDEEKYISINGESIDKEIKKEDLQNYCIINPPLDDWI